MKWKQPIFIMLTGVLSFFMLWIFISADRGCLPFFIRKLYDFPFGDKVGHFFLMGGFTWIVQILYMRICINNTAGLVRTAMIIAAIVTLEEMTQLYFGTRTFSLIDLVFSVMGIAVVTLINLRIAKKELRRI